MEPIKTCMCTALAKNMHKSHFCLELLSFDVLFHKIKHLSTKILSHFCVVCCRKTLSRQQTRPTCKLAPGFTDR